ncbi:MAG: YggS family pyridoxal phosphate-dependent enzyme [Elusimicrobiota bacterium]
MLLDNLNKIRYRIRSAAERAGRDPDRVGLVVVTKYATLEQVREALATGQVREVGENRVQDTQAKKLALGELAGKVRWRLIGHLQTNKAKKAVELFDAVDSIDSLRLAESLEKALTGSERRLPVLIQVKLTDRETQSGVAPEELAGMLKALEACPHLDARGLMAIAPQTAAAEETRPHFRSMRRLFEDLFANRPEAQLSMGMSSDYEVAVEEGATLVRLGSTIFS